jgi:hypothetical protein
MPNVLAFRHTEIELVFDFVFHDYSEYESSDWSDGNWRRRPASENQVNALLRFGIDARTCPPNRGNASQLLGILVRRARKGLCDYRVARILFFEGVLKAHNLTAREAAQLLEALQEGGHR